MQSLCAMDHMDFNTRTIAFLIDRQGEWRLAPAFDVVWAFNPAGNWTSKHQMSINGKRDDFTRTDLSREAGVPQPLSSQIESTHRLALLKGERAHS